MTISGIQENAAAGDDPVALGDQGGDPARVVVLAVGPLGAAPARRFETGDSGDGTDIVDDFLCNLSRRFAQDSGQLERKGQCQVAHFDAGRSLHGQIGRLHAVVAGQEVAEMVSDLRDSGLKHTRVS